jgi:hypothetical protein
MISISRWRKYNVWGSPTFGVAHQRLKVVGLDPAEHVVFRYAMRSIARGIIGHRPDSYIKFLHVICSPERIVLAHPAVFFQRAPLTSPSTSLPAIWTSSLKTNRLTSHYQDSLQKLQRASPLSNQELPNIIQRPRLRWVRY